MTDTAPDTAPDVAPHALDAFIARWQKAGGTERANYQMFLTELTQLLGLPAPDPACDDTRDNAYVFERRVTELAHDGTTAPRFIDLYRRGAFICEAKRVKAGEHTREFGQRILGAYNQALTYVRSLPASEGRPPFVLVVDVGNFIEVFAEFSRSGGHYTQFPDARSCRIRVADLRLPEVRDRLRRIWLDPLSLDPAKQSARVTRDIAARLATVAKALEGAGHPAEQVAGFLTRCLFTFFAEDVGLLPKRAFADLLETLADKPQHFVPVVTELWRAMDTGQFSTSIRHDVLHFNGKLFKNPEVLPLDRDQIALLIDAARADWQQVEPAIFGTLLERALNPDVRHALGAHYTPRAYVERLVFPTVIDPLRDEWKNVQVAALALAGEDNLKEAEKVIRQFHHRLCNLRVLDPACGSGNFLYVTLEHLKRLEGEVLNQLADLGVTLSLETEGLTVDPHQFLGIEINPRAAAVAEMVLWIGYLQWHFRTRGEAAPPQPVLRDFHNIECRDAVLAYDRVEFVLDEHGKP
ncbi:MAG: DNA methyltransferase, partial [Gammaproteobacteria bacterium]